ncbi:MAG TPA: flagellar hook-basal body complex protein FliE [Gammaproteobacteria bacterium]|nr:flagellar hook-basal body complex protein FliE [Gammaproteobacteria bacterium]
MSDVNIDQVLSQLRAMSRAAQGAPVVADSEKTAPGDFAALFKAALDGVNARQKEAGELAAAFEKGDDNVDLTEVMIALQKSRVSFQAMMEVRNKLVSAYKDVMSMTI